MEGIEPSSGVLETLVLPMNYTPMMLVIHVVGCMPPPKSNTSNPPMSVKHVSLEALVGFAPTNKDFAGKSNNFIMKLLRFDLITPYFLATVPQIWLKSQILFLDYFLIHPFQEI